MIQVSIVSGFLGAGKTTLIKKLISDALGGQKVILLENEYGEVGIDGGFMKDSGIRVTELNSGCICCTLVGDFHKAIDELINTYSPDRIIIEPSGVGKLSEIRAVIEQAKQRHPLAVSGCATVVDAQKCRMYLKNFGEFFTDQVRSAETVILSRTQLLSHEKLEEAISLIRGINPDARILTTPWDELSGAQILDTVEHPAALIDIYELFPEAGHSHDEDDDDDDDEDDDDEHSGHDHEHEHGETVGTEGTVIHRSHHHHHHHHHGEAEHDADEVFENIGIETAHRFTEQALGKTLESLKDDKKFGQILRAKGIVQAENGDWLHFDYVPGESEIRHGTAEYTGRLCVIGSGLKESAILSAFGLTGDSHD